MSRKRTSDLPVAKNEIVVYQPDETIRLDVRLTDDTVWLNRQQMAQLFGRDVKTIGKHIANALSEELAAMPVVAKSATTSRNENPLGAVTVSNVETVRPVVPLSLCSFVLSLSSRRLVVSSSFSIP